MVCCNVIVKAWQRGGLAFALFFCVNALSAQVTNTNSPYSRFGLGDREVVGYSKSQAMGGIAYGLRDKNYINAANPAAFSSQDSLSFILEMAFKGRYMLAQSQNDSRKNVAANVHHVAMQFPIWKYFGMAIGFQPYSQMGFDVVRYETRREILSKIGNIRYKHHGYGGLNEAFGGLSYKPHKLIAVGVNFRFLFGALNFSQNAYVPHNALYADIRYDNRLVLRGYGITSGLQAAIPFSDTKLLRLGAILELVPKLVAERRLDVSQVYLSNAMRVAYNSKAGVEELKYPMRFGAGLYYQSERISGGFDFSMQDWSAFRMPGSDQQNAATITLNAGLQWIPNPSDLRYYMKRVHYRLGAYFTQLPMRIGENRLQEIGFTFGLGLPYKYTGSTFHTTFRFGTRGNTSNGLLREFYSELILGVSLNDVWFVKRKFQ